MDTVTQMALGATIGEAGYGHKLGRKALAFGAVCGLLPDLDVLFTLGDRWASLVHHRGYTHSLFVLPVAALVISYVARRLFDPRGSYSTWLRLGFWALITHTLLDVCTMYGTQILLPLTDHRFALDAISIIDPLYSLPLFGIVGLASVRTVSVARTQRWARIALAATTLYIGAGFTQSKWVAHRAHTHLQQAGFEPVEVRAVPTLLNNVVYRIVARNPDRDVALGMTSTVAPSGDLNLVRFDWPKQPAVERAISSRRGQILEWFADGFVRADVLNPGNGRQIEFVDVKYGGFSDLTTPIFGARFVVDEQGEVVSAKMLDRPEFDIQKQFRALWRRLLGRSPPTPGSASPIIQP